MWYELGIVVVPAGLLNCGFSPLWWECVTPCQGVRARGLLGHAYQCTFSECSPRPAPLLVRYGQTGLASSSWLCLIGMAGNSLTCVLASADMRLVFECNQLAILVLCSASETAAFGVCLRTLWLTESGLVTVLPVLQAQ